MADTTTPSDVSFLGTRLAEEVASFRKRRDSNRQKAFLLKISIVVLGTLTTVALGIKPYLKSETAEGAISIVALLLSAGVPILSAWDSFFNYRSLWTRYTNTLGRLYGLQDQLKMETARGAAEPEVVKQLFDRFQNTMSETNDAWVKQRETEAGIARTVAPATPTGV